MSEARSQTSHRTLARKTHPSLGCALSSPAPTPLRPDKKSLSRTAGVLEANSPLREICSSTYWTKLEKSMCGSLSEDDEAESLGQIAMGNFT